MQTLQITAFLLVVWAQGPSLASPPTEFPSSGVLDPLLNNADLSAWQGVFDSLAGSSWTKCAQSRYNPCLFSLSDCDPSVRVLCRQDPVTLLHKITDIVLPANNLVGNLPVTSLDVLGPSLEVLVLTGNPGLSLSSASCAQLDFCYRRGIECQLDFPLCSKNPDLSTLSPTIYPPLHPEDARGWEVLYTRLGGKRWTGGCSDAETEPCLYSDCIECVLSNGYLHISKIKLSDRSLLGFLSDGWFAPFRFIQGIDISKNSVAFIFSDCLRIDACLEHPCDFSQQRKFTGELNPDPVICSPAIATGSPIPSSFQLSERDLLNFQWFYNVMNGNEWNLDGCDPNQIFNNPCFACPLRIMCERDPTYTRNELVLTQLRLRSFKVRGALPSIPLNGLIVRGLKVLDLSNFRSTSAHKNQISRPAGEPCLTGCTTLGMYCDFSRSGYCEDEFGSPPRTQAPSTQSLTGCATSGGLAPHRTPCASSFTFNGVRHTTCLSFREIKPLNMNNYNQPEVPTDLWCATQTSYDTRNQDHWGFCDCSETVVVTPAPFVAFTLEPAPGSFSKYPTSEPTTLVPTVGTTQRPTSRQPTPQPSIVINDSPTNLPTSDQTSGAPSTSKGLPSETPSPSLSASDLAAWKNMYDALAGGNWTSCANNRELPCSCSGANGISVQCSAANSTGRNLQEGGQTRIKSIDLPQNNAHGEVPVASVESMDSLERLNLEGNAVTLPAGSTCSDLSICSTSCKIGDVCGSPPPANDVTIIAIVLVVVLLLLCCCAFCCFRMKNSAASTKRTLDPSKYKEDQSRNMLIPAQLDDEENDSPEFGDPRFTAMARKISAKPIPSHGEQRPQGISHFSKMRQESYYEQNPSLNNAKLGAMQIDNAARKDVPDMEGFLENLGLEDYAPLFRRDGVTSIMSLAKVPDNRMKEFGMSLGERIKLKRGLDVRVPGRSDPIFG